MSVGIREIHIRDFRGVRGELHLDLSSPTGDPLDRVVLAGANGSGKTSVLEAVLLALGREDLLVRDLPDAAREDHWRTSMGPSSLVRVTIDDGPDMSGAPQVFTIERTLERHILSMSDGKGEFRLVDNGRPISAPNVEYFSSWRSPTLPGSVSPRVKGGGAAADNEANRLLTLKQRIVDERARRAFSRDPSALQDQAWLDRINAVWRAFHDDGSLLDAGIVEDEEDEGFDLFVFEADGQRRCSIDQVSSGELELLTLAGTLIVQDFDGLLLIDEPELHLHPQWERVLLDALRAMAPDAHLILATHSEAIWDQAYSYERRFLAPASDPRSSLHVTDEERA